MRRISFVRAVVLTSTDLSVQQLSDGAENDAFLGPGDELGDLYSSVEGHDKAKGESITEHDDCAVYLFVVVYAVCDQSAATEFPSFCMPWNE